mmetsp:Transcript_33356/g.61233  ORF Transcript_33356/g.61233 Transcript_33356/m.61233 type:complete len:101 (-) Transcript_33356:1425-1727(-)
MPTPRPSVPSSFILLVVLIRFTLTVTVVNSLISPHSNLAMSDNSNNGGSTSKQHFDVPPAILEDDNGCECREEIVLAVRLALEGEYILIYVSTKCCRDLV